MSATKFRVIISAVVLAVTVFLVYQALHLAFRLEARYCEVSP